MKLKAGGRGDQGGRDRGEGGAQGRGRLAGRLRGVHQELERRHREGTRILQFLFSSFFRMRILQFLLEMFCKFLAGSFSVVSKRNFARKYAFDSIFQALQDLHPFSPLQSQNFRKKSV